MTTKPRYLLEGLWSGYHHTQQRIVHREIISAARYANLKLRRIIFTDGTHLDLLLRFLDPRERTIKIDGYTELILKAEKENKVCVFISDLLSPDVNFSSHSASAQPRSSPWGNSSEF